jgi:hypothetical protein
MACEDTLNSIAANTAATNAKLDSIVGLLTQIRDNGASSGSGGMTSDQAQDMITLLASMYGQAFGDLPALNTVVGG